MSKKPTQDPRYEYEKILPSFKYHNPDHQGLRDLGFNPTTSMDDELAIMLKDLEKHANGISKYRDALLPDIRWDGTTRKSEPNGVILPRQASRSPATGIAWSRVARGSRGAACRRRTA